MDRLITPFASLSADEIRSLQLDQHNDYDLHSVLKHFLTIKDKRSAAVLELILHSHDHSELIYYDELYSVSATLAYGAEDWENRLKWAYAELAFNEQHYQGDDRISIWGELADIYGVAGDLDACLTILARCLENKPDDPDLSKAVAHNLANFGLRQLALEAAAHARQQARSMADETRIAYIQGVHDELAAASEETMAPANPPGPEAVAAFRRALTAEVDEDADIAYAPLIGRLLEASDEDSALIGAEILARGKTLAGDLIRLAFDPDYDQTPAARAAIDLLRQLHRRQTVALDELGHFLEHANGDWRPLLCDHFGKFGPYPLDEIEAVALDVNTDHFVRSTAIIALRERADKVPGQRESVVAILRALLTRPQAIDLASEEAPVAYAINSIVSLKATELYPEIERAYAEDRVDLQVITLSDVQEAWGLPLSPRPQFREDGLYLPLQCQKCDRIRTYFVQHIFFDLETADREKKGERIKYSPYVMDREIVCPKCGARDRYHLTAMAIIQLYTPASSDDFAKILSNRLNEIEFESHPRLSVGKATAFSQFMHPLEALARYKMLILTHPRRAENYIRIGKILRVLRRSAPAREAIRKGYDLEPDNLDYIIERALLEHDLGDKNLARSLYDQVIQRVAHADTQDELMLEMSAIARQGKETLRKGRPSPWHEMVFGRPERPA